MTTKRGFNSPREGQSAFGGNYTVWCRLRDGLWYSPRDIPGIKRGPATHEHMRALKRAGTVLEIVHLPRTRK
jgi:hypothetical protein